MQGVELEVEKLQRRCRKVVAVLSGRDDVCREMQTTQLGGPDETT